MLLHDNEMNDLVHDYHARGYQLAVHAIGDAAIEQTLNAFESALDAMPDPDRRHRIEHAGYARADQNARMKRLGRSARAAAGVHLRFRRSVHFRCGRKTGKAFLSAQNVDRYSVSSLAGSDAPRLRHQSLSELLLPC